MGYFFFFLANSSMLKVGSLPLKGPSRCDGFTERSTTSQFFGDSFNKLDVHNSQYMSGVSQNFQFVSLGLFGYGSKLSTLFHRFLSIG